MEVPAGEFADDLSNGVSGSGQLGRLHSRTITCESMTLSYGSYICYQYRHSAMKFGECHGG